MDRPPSKVRPVVKGLLAVVTALIAGLFILLALRSIGGFILPESGSGLGSVGHLFIAAVFLVIAGPFVAVTLVLGLPLVSDNPKYRGADR